MYTTDASTEQSSIMAETTVESYESTIVSSAGQTTVNVVTSNYDQSTEFSSTEDSSVSFSGASTEVMNIGAGTSTPVYATSPLIQTSTEAIQTKTSFLKLLTTTAIPHTKAATDQIFATSTK